MTDVAGNWRRITDRVAAAALRSGRDPAAVRVLAVSKTQPVSAVAAVVAAGARHVGENYVQEAAAKISELGSHEVTWHLIGHLQRNKARRAVELFDVIHTVDSAALARSLNRHALELSRRPRVLIEVNLAGEGSKSGVAPEDVEALLIAMSECSALRLEGLMAIPPAVQSPQRVRPHFRMLRELCDRLQTTAPNGVLLRELSMGMTDDFEVAIEEGATMVRIGRAIFGDR